MHQILSPQIPELHLLLKSISGNATIFDQRFIEEIGCTWNMSAFTRIPHLSLSLGSSGIDYFELRRAQIRYDILLGHEYCVV